MKPKGWHSRGYLPHFDGGEITQFITFRLHDSLPQKVIERWQLELESKKELEREMQMRRRAENFILTKVTEIVTCATLQLLRSCKMRCYFLTERVINCWLG